MAAADHLPIRTKVRANAELRLHSTRSEPEACNDLIEDQRRARGLRDAPHLTQERDRLQARIARLHRLHEHGGQLSAVCPQICERLFTPILEHSDVARVGRWNARCDGRAAVRRPAQQHLIEGAVIVAGKIDDPVASGHGARHAHRGHHGFRARVAERHALIAGELAEQRRHLAGQRRLRPDRHATIQLLPDRRHHERRRVPEHHASIPIDDVDVLIAIDIPDTRSLGAIGHQRIDHLLPLRPVPGHRAWIGQPRPRLLRSAFGPWRTLLITCDEPGDVALLAARQLRLCARLQRPE